MQFILTTFITVVAVLSLFTWSKAADTQANVYHESGAASVDSGWPRKFAASGAAWSFYQPQVEEWVGNRLSARSAVSVVAEPSKSPLYGVLWFTARTEIDKSNRSVKLSDLQVTKLSLPSALDKVAAYQAVLSAKFAGKAEIIGLDRLVADMLINAAQQKNEAQEVKNDPPQVIFSTKPSLLVTIDGKPELRPVKDTNLDRVINTRFLIVRDRLSNKFYLHLVNGWMEANEVAGEWRLSGNPPTDLRIALEAATETKRADVGTTPSSSKATFVPEVFVTTVPTELIQTAGEPQVASIEGTQLIFVTNTENDIFVHMPAQDHYVLIAGRWFRSSSMKGPWSYVSGEKLPSDFSRIPSTHAKAKVLASIPGTPQAKEALIANSIPQTATITKSIAALKVSYDGPPQFKRIEGTPLQYAVNTAIPVIAVDRNGYYAVQNGVWFAGMSPSGPWSVATSVPAVIYSIPPSSPMHYITYVKIYGSTPEVVYVGYTPGYQGTVVTSSSVVVYGTGWYYPPYVGTYWYGAPYTYGYGASFTWGATTGWGFVYGYNYGWSSYYYPAAWYGTAGYAAGYYGAYGWGGVAATNVYGQWGNVAYSGTKAAWADPYTGNVGRGGVFSGTNYVTGTRYTGRGSTNTNVYKGTTMTGGGGTAYNPNTGRISAGQAGTVSNAYTGNSAAGTRGVTYNPQTGVVSGGSVGGVRNGSTGQVTAGGTGFAYNANTNTGVAVANNNVYAGKDGNVYRYNRSSGVQQNTGSGWQSVERSSDRNWVQNQQQARSLGERRTRDFSSLRGNTNGGFRVGPRRR